MAVTRDQGVRMRRLAYHRRDGPGSRRGARAGDGSHGDRRRHVVADLHPGPDPPAITATYNGTPPTTPPTCLAYQGSDTGFTSGFVPSGATPPGIYATECTDGSIIFTPGIMTVVPYLQVNRSPGRRRRHVAAAGDREVRHPDHRHRHAGVGDGHPQPAGVRRHHAVLGCCWSTRTGTACPPASTPSP